MNQSKEFLRSILKDEGYVEGYIEIRMLYVEGEINKSISKFYNTIDDINWDELKKFNENNYQICFGVCTRKQECGKKECVKSLSAIWVDVDCKDEFKNKDEALEHIKSVVKRENLVPNHIVDSGNGYHLYFLLDEVVPVTQENTPELENILKSIKALFRGDGAVCEISRVMRLPGFYNTKDPNNQKLCSILEVDYAK